MDAKTPSDATPATNPAEIGSKSVEPPAVVAPAEDGVLPELPPTNSRYIGFGQVENCGYTADQMHAMYRQAIAHAQRSSVDETLIRDLTVEADFAWPPGERECFIGSREQRIANLLRRAIAALREQGGQDGR